MSWLNDFLHPGRQYQAAQNQMKNYYDQAQGGMQPFMQQGQNAGEQLTPAMQKLLDPQSLQAEWMNSYETSPQAKFAQEQAQQSGLDAASSMGLMGSQPALSAIQGGAANISMQDRQSYLNDLMEKYKTGIGLGQNMYGVGAQTAGQAGQNAMSMGDTMGTLAANKQGAGSRALGGIGGTLMGLAGGALGGPIGYGMMNKLMPGSMSGWSTGGR